MVFAEVPVKYADVVAHCQSCGAPIVWAVTDSGKRMPVDPRVVDGGKLKLYVAAGVVRVRHVAAPDGALHRPHFATCPDAESWRRRR